MRDKIDEQILEALRRDSRVPVTDLSRKVGRSRTAVQARLSRLEQTQQILGYTIKEPSTVETGGIGAIVLINMEIRSKGEAAAREFATMPEVASCLRIVGNHDFALLINPIEKPRLNLVLEQIYKIDGVKRTETIMALSKEF
jgi:Lrp/AsnC family leucine-responsive transcriptional regulator